MTEPPVLLGRDAILAAEDVETETVFVPQWGGSVTVRGLSGRERNDYEASMAEQRGKKLVPNLANLTAKLVVRCVVNADGTRVFKDTDANALGEKSGAALEVIAGVARRLSGLRDEDDEEAQAEMGEGDGGGSPTASPSTSDAPSNGSSPNVTAVS
jgi:hypothetical protein